MRSHWLIKGYHVPLQPLNSVTSITISYLMQTTKAKTHHRCLPHHHSCQVLPAVPSASGRWHLHHSGPGVGQPCSSCQRSTERSCGKKKITSKMRRLLSMEGEGRADSDIFCLINHVGYIRVKYSTKISNTTLKQQQQNIHKAPISLHKTFTLSKLKYNLLQ